METFKTLRDPHQVTPGALTHPRKVTSLVIDVDLLSIIWRTDVDVETMDCDEGEIVETSGNEVEQDESSEIGEVVWAKVSGWRWWPGVVQKRVPTLLVDFFGEDHRGMNTSATLVSLGRTLTLVELSLILKAKKNVRPFRGMLEYEKFKYSSLNNASGGELRKILKDFKPIGSEKWDEEEEEEEWRSSVEGE